MSELIEIIDENGAPRLLQPFECRSINQCENWTVFGETPATPDLIPEDQWVPTSFAPAAAPVEDQDGIGMCNASDTCAVMEFAMNQQTGGNVRLSAGDLYREMCRLEGHPNRDVGTSLESAVKIASTRGVATTKVVPYLEWKSKPAGADADAAGQVLGEFYWCPTVRHLVSAQQRGFSCSIGIIWSQGDKLDHDGVMSNSPAPGKKGGHAIMRCDLRSIGGRLVLWGPNSWSEQYGVKGWFGIPLARLKAEEGQFGWWAARIVKFNGSETPPVLQ